MKTRRLFTVLLTVILAVILLAVGVSAETIVASGTAGKLNWEVDSEGTLTISGNAKMPSAPYDWAAYAEQVTKIVFEGGVKSVGERAFEDMVNVTEVDLGNAMERIEPNAFIGCISLRAVSFPASMELIDRGAFWNCPSLAQITFSPDTVSLEIGEDAFYDTAVEELTFPSGVKTIGDYAFARCQNLKTLNLTEGLELIGEDAFYECYALTGHLYLPESLESLLPRNFTLNSWTSIEIHRFHDDLKFCGNTKLKKVVFDGVAVRTGWNTFSDCTNLETVIFKTPFEGIAGYTFTNCKKLTSIDLPETVTYIGAEAFKGSGLKKIVIPAAVTDIDSFAFAECASLEEVYFTGNAPYFWGSAFQDTTTTVYYPENDPTWTKEIRQNYDGDLTWVPYAPEAVKIVEQPKNTYAKEGDTAKVTVNAEGEGLTYQWYIKNDGKTKYSKSSVTSATYSCKMSDTSKNRLVYCIVTDAYGNQVKSKTVILREKVSVTTEPSNTYTKAGSTAKVTVKASGDGLKYQWYIKNAGKTKYSKSSVTSATYSCKMNEKSKDRLVYCIVTDAYGYQVKSKTVILREAASITQQPQNASAAEGEVVKINVAASGDGLKYQWYIKNATGSKFSKSSVTSATYSCKMSEKADGRQVYCVVTDKYGKTAKSETVTLSMSVPAIYLNESGTKYHYDPDCAGKTAYEVTLSEAIAAGRTPCSKCVG